MRSWMRHWRKLIFSSRWNSRLSVRSLAPTTWPQQVRDRPEQFLVGLGKMQRQLGSAGEFVGGNLDQPVPRGRVELARAGEGQEDLAHQR